MAVLAECARCRRKQATKNKICRGCEHNLDKAKQSKRVRYWINYKLPGGQQGRELVGKSMEKARHADGKRRGQKREGRLDEIFAYKKESTWTFKQLADWWLKQDNVKARSDHSRLKIAFAKLNEVFGDRLIGDLKVSELRGYQAKRLSEGRACSTTDHETHSAAKAAVKVAWHDNGISAETWKTWQNLKKLISERRPRRSTPVTGY